MIDLLLFRKILNADYGFIENNDTIPLELFELLCEHHTDKIKALFAKAEGKSASPYTYEVHARCGCARFCVVFSKNVLVIPLASRAFSAVKGL